MVDWAMGGDGIGFIVLPWEEITSAILSRESAFDYAISNNIDLCSDPNRSSTIEITNGGCYYLEVIVNELEVRRIYHPCDPTAVVSCYQYWSVCKEWDPNNGWIIITERGPLLVPFTCSPIIDAGGNNRECFPICE